MQIDEPPGLIRLEVSVEFFSLQIKLEVEGLVPGINAIIQSRESLCPIDHIPQVGVSTAFGNREQRFFRGKNGQTIDILLENDDGA